MKAVIRRLRRLEAQAQAAAPREQQPVLIRFVDTDMQVVDTLLMHCEEQDLDESAGRRDAPRPKGAAKRSTPASEP